MFIYLFFLYQLNMKYNYRAWNQICYGDLYPKLRVKTRIFCVLDQAGIWHLFRIVCRVFVRNGRHMNPVDIYFIIEKAYFFLFLYSLHKCILHSCWLASLFDERLWVLNRDARFAWDCCSSMNLREAANV